MLDLRQLRAFATVAREGTFTRAAAVLHYAQSSVTAQIQSLEAQLGVQLLDRLSTGVELTAAGEVFLPHADRLLALSAEACESVHAGSEPAGTLTLSACESVLTYRLPALLRTFQDRYPNVKVQLHAAGICEAGPPLSPGVDIAVSITALIQDPQLVAASLLSEPIYAVVARDHPLAGRKSILPQEVVQEQLLLTEESCSYRALFDHALSTAGVRPLRTLQFASVEAIKQCAKARMGIAVLPGMVIQGELDNNHLVALPWPALAPDIFTQLVRRKEKWFSPAMQAFWATALEVIGNPSANKQNAGPTSPRHRPGA